VPQFDQEKMVKLVSELRRSVIRLESIANLSLEEFQNDPDKIGSSKYHFIVAIEACIDMCNHVISRNGFRVPEDYADTFRVMSEVGAFDSNFSEELTNMAKFRNRLVHLYWEVDEQQLYGLLKSRLGDFKRFLDKVAEFLGWKVQASWHT
jgi:uncharacterized protein YutE (UPF0331/DUF86 family)